MSRPRFGYFWQKSWENSPCAEVRWSSVICWCFGIYSPHWKVSCLVYIFLTNLIPTVDILSILDAAFIISRRLWMSFFLSFVYFSLTSWKYWAVNSHSILRLFTHVYGLFMRFWVKFYVSTLCSVHDSEFVLMAVKIQIHTIKWKGHRCINGDFERLHW